VAVRVVDDQTIRIDEQERRQPAAARTLGFARSFQVSGIARL
jgi:hypothetical protein